jgi:hypothetical protein
MGGDTVQSIISFYGDLYIFGNRSIKRFQYTSDPAAGMVIDVPGGYGVYNAACVKATRGGIIVGWGRNGAFVIDAMMPKRISDSIQEKLDANGDPTGWAYRFICYEPIRDEMLFFYDAGLASCYDAFAFSFMRNEWTLYKYRNGFTAALQMNDYVYGARLVLSSVNGVNWMVGEAKNDGGGDGVITALAGSTDTIINATNSAVVGQSVYSPDTGDTRTITVATGSQITLSSSLSRAPNTGEKFHIGGIRQRIVTDWWDGNGLNVKSRPTKLMMGIRPEGTMGTATVSQYQDFSASATPPSTFSQDTYPDGVSVTGAEMSVDLDAGGSDGFIPIPTNADWKRAAKFEIIAEDPYDGVRFIAIQFRNDSVISVDD